MQVLLSIVRTIMGGILRFLDYITRPSPLERAPEEQRAIEDELEDMALYQFAG